MPIDYKLYQPPASIGKKSQRFMRSKAAMTQGSHSQGDESGGPKIVDALDYQPSKVYNGPGFFSGVVHPNDWIRGSY